MAISADLRIVCISDTHGLHRKLDLPPGDILTVVQKKAKAAFQWCERATAASDKPWKYVLLPHDAIQINRTFAALVASV